MTELIGPRRGSISRALKIMGFTILFCVLLFVEVFMVLGQEPQIKDQTASPPRPAKYQRHTHLRCSNTSRQCWCVDKDGSPIEGSYSSPHGSDPDCDKFLSSLLTKPDQHLADKLGKKYCKNPKLPQVPKVDVCRGTKRDAPVMSHLDDHTQLRCSNVSRQCWCVDKNGSPIKDSYSSPYDPRPDCDKFLSSHLTKPDQHLADKLGIKDCKNHKLPQVPKVDVCRGTKRDPPVMSHLDAKYQRHTHLRCSNTSRQCWCVDKDGSPIKGSYSSPHGSDPDCDKFLSSLLTKPDQHLADKLGTKDCKNSKLPQVPKVDVCRGTKRDAPVMSDLDDDSDNKKKLRCECQRLQMKSSSS